MPSQCGFDLPGLDPEPTDLQLIVESPEELDRTIGQVARTVTGSIYASCAEWIPYETLRSLLRTIDVAARDSGSTRSNSPATPGGSRSPDVSTT